jgi:IS5 family transposase
MAPKKLLRALLLQVFYSLRSERLLMEELQYNLLFRRYVGLDLDAPVWDVTVFTKNRDRLLEGVVATAFFERVLAQATTPPLVDEHFTVDGRLIEAWAGQKSFAPKTDAAPMPPSDDPGNPSVDFRGERRTNATHASTTGPEARLYKKAAGQEATLCFLGHVLMENRHGMDWWRTHASPRRLARRNGRRRWHSSASARADSGSPRWDVAPSRTGFDGLCACIRDVSVSCNPGFSAACREPFPVPGVGGFRIADATRDRNVTAS